jgi:hypothetical protein
MGGKHTPNVWERQHVNYSPSPLSPCNRDRTMLRTVQRRGTREQDTYYMRHRACASTIASIALLLIFLQPAYAHGEHVHGEDLFLVFLGA